MVGRDGCVVTWTGGGVVVVVGTCIDRDCVLR